MSEAIKRSKEFDIAFQFITQTNQNVFLTGKAGTGKTTFLKYLKSNTHKNVVTAAPTGVAAINAGGVTLHSLFQLPFAPYIPVEEYNKNTLSKHPLLSQIRLNTLKRKVLKNMDLLIIDEVSMVASNTIDAIDIILKSVRKNFNHPFGGVQVLFIGDLRQLPPVIKNINSYFFNKIYPSYFFFDSIVLKHHIPVMIELKTIYRQEDNVFVEILNAVRENILTDNHLKTLNKRLKKDFQPNNQDGFITLTTHNSQADKINERQIHKIDEKKFVFEAKIKDDFPESMYPAEKKLILKKGAQVMFVKNDSEEKKYFNGKIGIVTHLSHNKIIVKCEGDSENIEVKEQKWENVHYKINEHTRNIEQNTLGLFIQLPIRLAWGITIHRSQGLTFNKLIIDTQKAFANGQVYVALSRVRSLDGLVLTSPISQKFLGTSNNLKIWEKQNNQPEKLPTILENSKIDYIRTECLRIFDWSSAVKAIYDLNNFAENNNLDKDIPNWTNECLNKITEINIVAKKFQKNINKLIADPEFKKNQSRFQQRLKESAEYFQPKIDLFKQRLQNHPISCKTKKLAEDFDELLEETGGFMQNISNQLIYLLKGTFDLSTYLRECKVNKTQQLRIRTTYLEKKKKSTNLVSVTEISHLDLYQEIAIYRKEQSNQKNIPIHRVFSNKTMREICDFLPKTEDSLSLINGLSSKNIEMYGEDLIEIVVLYCDKNNIKPKSLFG